jgi:superfamily II DNA/RNA helicase
MKLIPTPKDGEFSSFPEISQKSVANLEKKGFLNLFPIQQHCFYPIYQRYDVVARDLTGSGKTFAFGLPIIEYLRVKKALGNRRIQAIILAPTRELALQVTGQLEKVKHFDQEFRVLTVYGGV